MALLDALVKTSQRVTAAAGRLAKVAELAALLRVLPPEEIGPVAHYLSGTLPQGRIGIGYRSCGPPCPARCRAQSTLTVRDVDEYSAQCWVCVARELRRGVRSCSAAFLHGPPKTSATSC